MVKRERNNDDDDGDEGETETKKANGQARWFCSKCTGGDDYIDDQSMNKSTAERERERDRLVRFSLESCRCC